MKQIIICFDGQERVKLFDALRLQPSSPTAKIPDTLILYSFYDQKVGKYQNREIYSLSEIEYFYIVE